MMNKGMVVLKSNRHWSHIVISIFFACVLRADVLDAELIFTGFKNIAAVPSEAFTSIVLGFTKRKKDYKKHPAAVIWTIETHNETEISTIPADLVKASVLAGTLKFEFADAAFSDPEVAGVRIRVPKDKIKTVEVGPHETVQIASGFTSVTEIVAKDHSMLLAKLDNLKVNSTLTIEAAIESKLHVETNADANVEATDKSVIRIKGNVKTGRILGGSKLYVQGSIEGVNVTASEIFVNGGGCDKVNKQKDGSCTADKTTVSVTFLNTTMNSPSFRAYPNAILSILGSVMTTWLFL